MAVVRRWVLVLTALLVGGLRLGAASKEDTDFEAASRDLRAGSFARAEAGFGVFVQTYTNSSRLPAAVLYQAEARLKLGKPEGALQLLAERLGQAGKLAHEYLFWSGEALAQEGDYRAASDTFGKMLQQFPVSPHRLEAAFKQAVAFSNLHEWPRVVELLQQTNGAFQSAIRTNGAAEPAQRGLLLLSEAWLHQPDSPQKFAAAEAALQPLAKQTLKPDIGWRWVNLLCRIQLGSGRTNDALQSTTNLLALAAQTGDRSLQADSFAFYAGVLEGLGRLDEAIAAYTNNLTVGFPAERRCEALLKSAELFLAQKRETNAIQNLEKFVTQYSNAPAADLALLTLGELSLGRCVAGLDTAQLDTLPANVPGPTNAITRLQDLVQRFPQSPRVGKARLYLGWCYWLQTNFSKAQDSFQLAAHSLQPSLDQATAYFKLADAQFRQGKARDALTNYNLVVRLSEALPEVKATLLEAALYQVVRAGLAADQLADATDAMGKLLRLFPESYRTAPAVLLAGQAIAEHRSPAEARELLAGFAAVATNATLLPQVQLALARTWEEEGNWTNAIRHYTQLLATGTNSDATALAEYYRAQATWRAGDLTNALMLHTNFVVHFPRHPKAPFAQLWVADYYFNTGNFSAAELNYQQLCEHTNWQAAGLSDQAWMSAGRAAFQQGLWNNAANYFTKLTSNPNCPSNLWTEAMFAYGDCFRSQLSKGRGDTNNIENLQKAASIFGNIYEKYPSGPQALLALGARSDTLVQLARENFFSGNDYSNALSGYQQLITNSAAAVAVRSMAKLGLGIALETLAEQKPGEEQTALLQQALNQYLDVARGTILRADEKADPFMTQRAGDRAIGLAETLQAWTEAISLCNDFAQLFPSLSARYKEKAKTLAGRQGSGGGKS